MIPIIGLTGHMRAGKDTVGALLRMRGFTRFAFADELKKEIAAAITARKFPEGAPYPGLAREGALDASEVWSKPTKPVYRIIQQWWGTEYRRRQDPDYWVKKLRSAIRAAAAKDRDLKVDITDVRFANEGKMVDLEGGEVWLIQNTTHPDDAQFISHASERLELKWSTVIPNTGTIYDLAGYVNDALDSYLAKQLGIHQKIA